ncbi:alpha/beta fold hydrolase [Streptomyces misionensis]|uniref:alpha/beta fold hydrolase n=1 Tax=Streptomyces misionensis TaxID=67331 RepID=UPI0036AA8ECC
MIVPSLPGFAFSPQRPTLTASEQTHDLWHRLMHDHLGFRRYAAHGGDLGAGITSRLAEAHPEAVVGIHLLAAAAPPTTTPRNSPPRNRHTWPPWRPGRRRKAATSTSRAPAPSPSPPH